MPVGSRRASGGRRSRVPAPSAAMIRTSPARTASTQQQLELRLRRLPPELQHADVRIDHDALGLERTSESSPTASPCCLTSTTRSRPVRLGRLPGLLRRVRRKPLAPNRRHLDAASAPCRRSRPRPSSPSRHRAPRRSSRRARDTPERPPCRTTGARNRRTTPCRAHNAACAPRSRAAPDGPDCRCTPR